DLALEQVIRLLERMVVRMRDRTGLVRHHEHRVQLRVEARVDEHLHGDAAVRERRRRHARGDGRRSDGRTALQPLEIHLALGEQEEVPVARVAHVERLGGRSGRRPEEERVAAVWARPRRPHLDPAAAAAKGVRDADGNRAARAGLQRDAATVEVEHRLALEDVEARLERVQVLVQVAVVERDECQGHVRRPERAVDEPARREAARAARKRLGGHDVLAADEAIGRASVGELARAAVAQRGTAAGSTTAAEATAAATSSGGRPLSDATRSAPRTYVRPATSNSSAGKRVITSQPVAVTTTSSSIRAADRPSVAAQYVSSAKTMPSSISTGWSRECTREIIGDS